jgi:CheY-like chemotaxis protein
MRNFSLLIIDDALFMRKVIRGALEELFTSVTEASNSIEALTCVQNCPADLITLDLSLDSDVPLQGIILLKQLKKITPESMVVVISALDQSPIIEEVLAAGAANFVKKPFEGAHLRNTVLPLLSRIYG